MPSDWAASVCPSGDRDDPGADDLGHVGALVEAEREQRREERR